MGETALTGVAVVVPSLNPTDRLTDTVDGLLEAGFSRIVLVDDGSRPDAGPFFEAAAPGPGSPSCAMRSTGARGRP